MVADLAAEDGSAQVDVAEFEGDRARGGPVRLGLGRFLAEAERSEPGTDARTVGQRLPHVLDPECQRHLDDEVGAVLPGEEAR